MSKLHILLEDTATDVSMEIEIESTMPVSQFADEVRREMDLPYTTDVRFRQIISQGRTYMQEDAIPEHVDNLWEGADDERDPHKRAPQYNEDFYTSEQGVCTEELFTVTGSSCRYIQGPIQIRCTLLEYE